MPAGGRSFDGGGAGGNSKQSPSLGRVPRLLQRPFDPPAGEWLSCASFPHTSLMARRNSSAQITVSSQPDASGTVSMHVTLNTTSDAVRHHQSPLPPPCPAVAQAGADFSARNAQLETPLHHACNMMDVAIIAILLHRGADESARNSNRQTCADVLGHGLDEGPGGERGDPALRERITAMLAKAPAERNWRRRSWIVMMRVREASRMRDRHSGEGRTARDRSDGSASAEGAEASVPEAVVEGRDEKQRCRDQGHGHGGIEGVDGVGATGVVEEGIRSCVAWVVRAQEEGIFREVVAFL